MLRFLALAVPVALLVLAGVAASATALDLGPDRSPLAARGVARTVPLPVALQLGGALFEAVALVALFLLVEGRSGSALLDGLAAGLAAWLFRGPLLVLAVATLTRLPTAPFWQLARIGLVALPAAGLAVGAIARWQKP
ncbi:MAG TPA: hypothetical protein VGC00_07025 [Thermoanaerobaculia bacterium]